MAQGQIDLLSLFGQVSKSLQQNKDSLNQADTYNHDHGDHMVEIFEVITEAMKQKKSAEPADQLEYAAQLLRKKSTSGSGKLYADNLATAAKNILGKELNAGTVLTILQTLMGASQKSSQGGTGDMLGSLLGGLMSGGSGSSGSGDMLGSLLGQLGGGASGESNQGLDLSDLLGAGMEMLSNSQSGKSGLEALTGALLSGSQMSESSYRSQSGEIVTNALLGALSSMMKK